MPKSRNESTVMGSVLTRNPFEALAERAAKAQWCWQIYCTTCGHREFRSGLGALAWGLHPDAVDWDTQLKAALNRYAGGPLWSVNVQERLLHLVSDANMNSIAAVAPFPDWLGYLGLALHYSQGVRDVVYHQRLALKLSRFAIPGSSAQLRLTAITQAAHRLQQSDLQQLEHDYLGV
jgi:hypothetical protein